MKKVLCATLALAVFGSSLAAAASPGFTNVSSTASLPAPLTAPAATDVQVMDPLAMETSRGGLGPLALALGIASLDLALAGFFWGIYVPHYAPQSGIHQR